jgi:3-hydroxyphenylacetate 6-hydroxylase
LGFIPIINHFSPDKMSEYSDFAFSLHGPLGAVVVAGLLFLIYVLVNEFICYHRQIPGFPKPPAFPLVGNLHQLRTNAAEQYRRWAKDFGDVYQVRLGNLPVLVINSAAAARVILGHNSQATASRPELYTYHKVCSRVLAVTHC